MSAKIFVSATITNGTSAPLALADSLLQWGVWVNDPTNTILPGQSGRFIARGVPGNPIGVVGAVTYLVDGQPVILQFDRPYTGSHQFTAVSEAPGVTVTNNEPQGLVANVRYTLTAA